MTKDILGNGWTDWLKKQGVFAVFLAAAIIAYWQGIALPTQRLQQQLIETQIEATKQQSQAYMKLATDVAEMRREHVDQLKKMDEQLTVLRSLADCAKAGRKGS